MKISVNKASKESHDRSIREMSKFFESDRPKLGIFWFNPTTFSLFGVSKEDADVCIAEGHSTYPKLHKTFWQKQHHRARAKGDVSSLYYEEHNYTMIPRGRVFFENEAYIVRVGEWLNEIDKDRFYELIQDEFSLPDDYIFEIDEH